MKKQGKRIYAALLCSCMVLSLVSTPVSAAETGQPANIQAHTEELVPQESVSGNEAASVSENEAAASLNGLSVSALAANRVAEVTTAEHLTDMLADSSIFKITLAENIDIDSTLTVNRTVTLDLNGNVLKMTGSGSVIKVESGGNLTIQDSGTTIPHNFTPGGDGLWGLDETGGSEIVYGGVITGGNTPNGGGVYMETGGQLTMTGGNIVGCLATSVGGGVCLEGWRGTSDQTVFTMTGGSITGCKANGTDGGGGVNVAKGTFIMKGGSIIACISSNSDPFPTSYGGGVHIRNGGSFTMSSGTIKDCRCIGNRSNGGGVYVGNGQFTMEGGSITGCKVVGTWGNERFARGGGVYNCGGSFTMSGGIIESNCTADGSGGGVYNENILYANGGEIAGDVMNGKPAQTTGTITGSGGTKFSGKVTNNKTQDDDSIIESGTFTGEVSNEGKILGGDFSKATLSGTLVITFDPNNGEQPCTKEVHLGSDGAALTPPDPAPTKEGYILDGWYWYYNNNGTETKWNFDTDKAKYTMTLKAKWAFRVTLYPNGGTIASGKEVTGYIDGTGAALPTADDITREGYRFDGWYADSSFSGSPVTEIADTETGEKTFYAKWTRSTTPVIPGNVINYIVEHYKADGSGYTLAETEHSAGKTGDTVTATPKTYDGFTYNASVSIASGTLKKISSPADIVTLKLYYDVSVYTVSVSAASAECGIVSGAGTYAWNTSVTVTATAHSGYRFVKWTENGAEVSTDTSYTFPAAADRNLVAVFEQEPQPVVKYTVTVDGSYAEASGAGHYVAKDTVTINAGTRDGYTFSGWTSGDGVTFADAGSATTTFIMPERAVTVTANWKSTDSGSGEKADREETAPAVKNTPSYVIHTVQAGDSLWAISRKYGCPVAVIVAANSDLIKNPNLIYAGWQLRIPLPGTGSTPDAVLPENQKRDIYVVRKGDTLWAIARKCGCSVAEIISLNRELIRNPARIYPGWELKISQD